LAFVLVLVRFWAFFKNAIKYCHKKSMSKTFSKQIDKNFDVTFSWTFFVFSRFREFFSDGSSKTHKKNVLQKKSCRKVSTKIRPKIQNRLFLDFFITFLCVSQRGEFKNLTLVVFWPLTHPPRGSPNCFGGPLALKLGVGLSRAASTGRGAL
jgi:hypothetical protein